MPFDPRVVVDAVRSVIGPGKVGLHDPDIAMIDLTNVAHCALNEPVGYGYINQLEMLLAAKCQREHAVAVSSGTAALHLALLAVGVRPGDEVIVPDMTFIAAANAVTYCGAHPLLLDVNHDGLSGVYAGGLLAEFLDMSVLRKSGRYSPITGRRLAAVIVVDLLGVPADLATTAALCNAYGVPMIEDAAEALGSSAHGAACGSFGDVSILSFNNNKIVTSGGGGAVLTNDERIAARVRYLATTAKVPFTARYDHTEVGFNYRMPNLCAALALGQLQRIGELVKRKRALAARYGNAFASEFDVIDSTVPYANCWLNAINIEPENHAPTMQALADAGIPCRALFTPLHRQAPYRDAPRIAASRATADFLFERIVCLPSGPNL
jgi:perosamine synthetase